MVFSVAVERSKAFLSTPPSRVATVCSAGMHFCPDLFLSTPPSRVATKGLSWRTPNGMFLSTPPSRVATPIPCARRLRFRVSIHATLAGGDRGQNVQRVACLCVSIHATLAGGDTASWNICRNSSMFLSTPPSRVATYTLRRYKSQQWVFLSTPPSRVATYRSRNAKPDYPVSIHATLAGGDLKMHGQVRAVVVSIHATLAGGDSQAEERLAVILAFLSTPPSRVATVTDIRPISNRAFLSTPPSRVATGLL